MPELSRFYGVIIKMFFGDHAPPHFHAEYGEHQALFELEAFSIIAGELPNRAENLVREWAELHQQELDEAWQQASQLQQPRKIDPLP